MQIKIVILILFSILIIKKGWSQDSDNHIFFIAEEYDFPYQLTEPDKTWKLPKKLVEISGLDFIDENRLACVQDEKGNVYIFNLKSGEVEKKINFGEDGDYEGIEITGNDAWVLKSSGTLIQVFNFLKETEPVAVKFSTELSRKNDAEGLGFDPISNSLLIACKGHPFFDKQAGKEFKAIYNFSLTSKKLNLKPFLLIEMDSIKFYKNYNTMTSLGVELLAYFDHSKGDISFQPSGIAVHPLTGNIYVLGSVGNLLLVFSREGKMLTMIKLRSKLYKQPEGICFEPDGTLYISNEGDDDKKSTILKFKPKSKH